MGQQVALAGVFIPFGEVSGHRPVLAGLMMFETNAAHAVGQGNQEVVVIIMRGAKQLVGLLHESSMCSQVFGLDLEQFRPIGDDVQTRRRRAGRFEIEPLEVAACKHGRVHEIFQRDRFKRRDTAGRRRRFQRRGELPAVGQPHAGFESNLPGIITRGINEHGVPLKVQHVRCNHDAALIVVDRRQELELDVERGRIRRDFDMESKHVRRISSP